MFLILKSSSPRWVSKLLPYFAVRTDLSEIWLSGRIQWKPNVYSAAAAAKSLQSCPTLCDPRDSSPPGSPVPGILQARTLEWVAISISNA